jgi:hypothetical protein
VPDDSPRRLRALQLPPAISRCRPSPCSRLSRPSGVVRSTGATGVLEAAHTDLGPLGPWTAPPCQTAPRNC